MTAVDVERLAVGDRIKFTPRGSAGGGWWTVRACDERYLIATMQQPFAPKGELIYTVVDREASVRSSLNVIGGGWDLTDAGVAEAMEGLRSGEWQLSRRRAIAVAAIEVRS